MPRSISPSFVRAKHELSNFKQKIEELSSELKANKRKSESELFVPDSKKSKTSEGINFCEKAEALKISTLKKILELKIFLPPKKFLTQTTRKIFNY